MKDSPASTQRNSKARGPLGIALILVAVVAILPMFLAQLQADDFCRALRISENSVVDCVAQDYQTFTGRWLSFGLEYAIVSQTQSQPGYGLVLLGIALVYLMALVCLLGALFPTMESSSRWLIAGSLLALYWVGLASTKDTCYWLCGSIEYQLSLTMILFAIALTIIAANRAAFQKPYQLPWLGAMLTAMAGASMHELYGLMLCILLTTGSVLAWKWRLAGKTIWFTVTALAIVSLLIVLLAPGNAVRSGFSEHSGDAWVALKVGAKAALQALPDWVFNVRLLIATLLLVACVPDHLKSGLWVNDRRKRVLLLVCPMVWLLLLGGAFLGPAWGTGHIVASRTLSAAAMIFLLGWFLNWLLLIGWLQAKSIQLVALHPLARTAGILLLAASLILTGNTRKVARELTAEIPAYVKAKAEWQAQLKHAATSGKKHVVLPPMINPPSTIGFSDITADPDDWINRCAAGYYGVETVRVQTK